MAPARHHGRPRLRGCVGSLLQSFPSFILLLSAAVTPGASGLVAPSLPNGAAQGRRVVDRVTVGDSGSEEAHEYAGSGVIEGITDGRSYRQARGWLRYSLSVYEDSEVTLGCTFRGSEGRRLTFEVLVDGVTAGSHSFQSASAAPASAEYRMPQAVTAGKTVISVTIRAVDGPTPGLIELRAVQEHLELPT